MAALAPLPSVIPPAVSLSAVAVPSASQPPRAGAQLAQAGQIPEKGDDAKAFYERFFSGGKQVQANDAPDPGLEPVKAGVTALLDHLAAVRMSWRSEKAVSDGLQKRLDAVIAVGQVPAHGPLDPVVLAELPGLADTLRRIYARPYRGFTQDASELLYSFGVLAGRAKTRAELTESLRWLYGTYRLGEAR